MAELKSTLKVYNEADLKEGPGVVQGQTIKLLIGDKELPSERIFAGLASFKPGVYEHLHWHPTEVFYYVISGRAVMKDIEGKIYDLRPGNAVYAPAGIAGSHDWDIKEQLQLIFIRATTDPEKIIQFTVDESSKESRIEFDYLIRQGGAQFRSFY